MLLHIDGSKHQWFGYVRWYDLIVILGCTVTQPDLWTAPNWWRKNPPGQ